MTGYRFILSAKQNKMQNMVNTSERQMFAEWNSSRLFFQEVYKDMMNKKNGTDHKNRIIHKWMLSIVTGLLAALLVTGVNGDFRQSSVTAWWGSLYPSFCFSEVDRSEQPKISFWLAKAFERW